MGRFHPRDPSELDPNDRELLRTSMERSDLDEAYDHLLSTRDRNVHRTLAHDPVILEGFRTWMSRLWTESGLSARRRELVVLTAARAADSRYEWHQHVRHGLAAGLSESEIRAISDRELSPFSDLETALIRYTVAVVEGTVDDEQRTAVRDHVDDETVVGLTMLATSYFGLARAIAAFGVRTEEPFVGWRLEEL